MNDRIAALCGFLDASHSQYHARAYLACTLDAAGYTRLDEAEDWALVPGGKYYVTRGGSALLAFRIPEGSPRGFLISAAHTDRPTFKVKENGELDGQYARLAVERYGGQILSPWLDRPLSIAGRVLVKTEKGAQVKLLDIDRDLLLIPNVAIHMNRSVNEGYKWNPVTDVIPLLGGPESKGKFQALLEAEAGGPVLSHDLFLYIRQKAAVWGIDERFVSSAALDDLECVWGCFQGFLKSGGSRCIPLFCALDHSPLRRPGQRRGGLLLSPGCRVYGAAGYRQPDLRRIGPQHPANAGPVLPGQRRQCPRPASQPSGAGRQRQCPHTGQGHRCEIQRKSQILHRRSQRRCLPCRL